MKQISNQIEIVDKSRLQSEACLVIIFLFPFQTIEYSKQLVNFLIDNQNHYFNHILVDTGIQVEFSEISNNLISLSNKSSSIIEHILKRSIFASFNQSLNTFHIHFSILTNSHSHNNQISIKTYTKKRKHLLFETNKTKANQTDLMTDFKFATILSSNQTNWSLESTHLLVSALRQGTIPVILSMNTKLPLSHLISWDEIIIRVPLARIDNPHVLRSVLESIDQTQLLQRQIKGANVYKSYFSSETQTMRTLLSAIQDFFRLNVNPMESVKVKELKYTKILGWRKNENRSAQIKNEVSSL
jgi:hypothetical protein